MRIKNPFSNKILSSKWNKLLLFLIIFHILFFSIFHILNKNYQTWDSAGHIGLSYRMAQEMERFLSGIEGTSIKSILKVSNYYPPFVQTIGAFTSLIFGYKSTFLLIESLIFFILSIIYVYKITFLLTKDQKKSFITSVIYSLFPQVIDQSHYFHLDIPLTALVLMAVYYLVLSDNFKNLWKTILFFISFSFIQLTKWTGFIFLVVPVVVVLYRSLIRKDTSSDSLSKVKIIRNIIIGSVTFLILVVPWYYVNWSELMAQVKIFSGGESDDPTNLWQSIMYYPAASITHQIMILPFAFAFFSIFNQIKSRGKKGLILIFSMVIPWLLFVFISNKNLRYTLPLLPIVAYLVSDFLSFISSSTGMRVKWLAGFTIVYLLVASFFLSFFRIEKQNPALKVMGVFFTWPKEDAWFHTGTSFYAYKPYRYPVDDMLDFIQQNAGNNGSALGVAVLIDSEEMSAATFELVRIENRYKNMYMPVPYFQFQGFGSEEEIEAFFTETNVKYVISSTYIGPEGLRNYQALKQCSDYLESSGNNLFDKIKTFDLPDGGKVFIYKIKDSISAAETLDGCKIGAGIDDGVETFKLTPNHTYVMFTGHFAIQDKVKKEYEPGVMYLVQVENTVHESMLDIYNLPKSGSSFCSIKGLDLDFSKEIKDTLTQENKCGEGIMCKKVVHVKWRVGDPSVEVKEYTPDQIN